MDTEGDSVNIIDSIRTQLEGLKRTEDGSLLYRLIERGLGKRPEDNASTDEAFLTFMYTLLERYAKNRDGDPITRIKVRVIQQRITPYLMQEDESAANNDATAEPDPPDFGRGFFNTVQIYSVPKSLLRYQVKSPYSSKQARQI